MGLIRATTVVYVDRQGEAGGVTRFTFLPSKPLKHVAGQHGFFFLPGAGMKPFSIASAPEDGDIVIATTLQSGSRFKTALARSSRVTRSRCAARASYPTHTESFRLDLKHAYPERPDATYCVSGSASFLKEAVAVLKEAGIPRKRIKLDVFRGS